MPALTHRPIGALDTPRPWSVDRYGRLLAGLVVAAFTLLGIAHHPYWHAATLLSAANLVLTSLTDRCVLHDLLVRLGAREREDLFLPGGAVRPDAARDANE